MKTKTTTVTMPELAIRQAKSFGAIHDLNFGQTYAALTHFAELLKYMDCPVSTKKDLNILMEAAVEYAKNPPENEAAEWIDTGRDLAWTPMDGSEIDPEELEQHILNAYEVTGVKTRESGLDHRFKELIGLGLHEGNLGSEGMKNEFKAAVRQWEQFKKDQIHQARQNKD